MLDMFPHPASALGHDVCTYSKADPTQRAMRSALGLLTEGELLEIERDLEYFEFSGILPDRIARLLGVDDDIRGAGLPLPRVA